jgi:hypothetical protein
LTENLAAKQFLIDQLDESLYTSLDDKLRILIEKSLGDRLDASEKSISKWILAFDDRIKDIDQEMKDRSIAIEHQIEKIKNRLDNWTLATSTDIKDVKDKSIAIDHQIKAIEARLDERLDDSLDDSLDNILYENYSEIFVDRLDESLDTNLDESLDNTTINGKNSAATRSLREIEPAKQWLTLKEILSQRRKNWPKSIEGLRKKAIREGWPSREIENRKEYQIP